MANVMQANVDALRGMLEERRGYAGVDDLLAWMATDKCDWATWPKVMREALCKRPADFRDYLAAPLANGMRDLSQGRKVSSETAATLRNRMKRCAWAEDT